MDIYAGTDLWAKPYMRQADVYVSELELDSLFKPASRITWLIAALVGIAEVAAKIAPAIILAVGNVICKGVGYIVEDFAFGKTVHALYDTYSRCVMGALVGTVLALGNLARPSLPARVNNVAESSILLELTPTERTPSSPQSLTREPSIQREPSVTSLPTTPVVEQAPVAEEPTKLVPQREWSNVLSAYRNYVSSQQVAILQERCRFLTPVEYYTIQDGDEPKQYHDYCIDKLVAERNKLFEELTAQVMEKGITPEQKQRRIDGAEAYLIGWARSAIGKAVTMPITHEDFIKRKLTKGLALKAKAVSIMDAEFQRIGNRERKLHPDSFDEEAFVTAYANYRAREIRRFDLSYEQLSLAANAVKDRIAEVVGPIMNVKKQLQIEGRNLRQKALTPWKELFEKIKEALIVPTPCKMDQEIAKELRSVHDYFAPTLNNHCAGFLAKCQDADQLATVNWATVRESGEVPVREVAARINTNERILVLLKFSGLERVMEEIEWFLSPPEDDPHSPFTDQQKIAFSAAREQLSPLLKPLSRLRAALGDELLKTRYSKDTVDKYLTSYEGYLRNIVPSVERILGEENGKIFISGITRALYSSVIGESSNNETAMGRRMQDLPNTCTAAHFVHALYNSLKAVTPSAALLRGNSLGSLYYMSDRKMSHTKNLSDRGVGILRLEKGAIQARLDRLTKVDSKLNGLTGQGRVLDNKRGQEVKAILDDSQYQDVFHSRLYDCNNIFNDIILGVTERVAALNNKTWWKGVSEWYDDYIGPGRNRLLDVSVIPLQGKKLAQQ